MLVKEKMYFLFVQERIHVSHLFCESHLEWKFVYRDDNFNSPRREKIAKDASYM
jgi:hypothetical protein